MIPFDAATPFPLLVPGQHAYPEEQEHSEKVDAWLGLNAEVIEKDLKQNADLSVEQRWIGLPVPVLLTPYTELRSILSHLAPRPGSTLVDLGAGYGRMGFVIGKHYPNVRFIGYELVAERVNEGKRVLAKYRYPLVDLKQADLSQPDFKPALAEYYFIYDFGTRKAIEKVLADLSLIAQSWPITVVGRGRSSRDAIERDNPWLSQVIPVEHHANYSIYRSAASA